MLRALLFFFLISFSSLYAQTIPLRHFTDEDGLISNVVYSNTRDRQGYMWFASDKGISRFNGLNFKNFTTADGLADNEVFNITEDLEGRLWFSSFNGAMCYYKDGKFFTAANTPWLKLPFKQPLLRSFAHKDSSISFIFSDNSRFVNVRHDQLHVYPAPDVTAIFASDPTLLAVKKTVPRKFRLLYTQGYLDIDLNGKILNTHYYPNPQGLRYMKGNIATGEGEYKLGKDGIYDIDEQIRFPIRTNLNFTVSIPTKIQGKNYFVGLLSGVLINDSIQVNTGNKTTYINDDVAGNIWFTTIGDGVYTFSKDFNFQRNFPDLYKGKVMHAKVKNGNVWFANNSGSLYEIKKDRFREILNNTSYASADNNFLIPGSFLITDSLDYVIMDGDRVTVIPHADLGTAHKKTAPFPVNSIKEIFHDGTKIIVASSHALTALDYFSLMKQGKVVVRAYNIRQRPGDARIYGRDVDPYRHSLWFSQKNALFELRDGRQIEKPAFRDITLRQFEFFREHIVGLSEDNKLIIARSYEEGAVPVQIVSRECTWSHIYQIDETRAIISTNNFYRLLTFNDQPRKGKPDYTIQAIEDPFVPLRAEYIACDSSNCYFFKNGAVTRIATHVLSDVPPPPIPVFAMFKTRTGTYPIRPEITIAYNESKNISISFDNISFIGKSIRCQYSISNNEKEEWNDISGNEINLNTPGYGTYTVKIRSATLSGGYSPPAVLVIRVQKPYWATWWFITLSALVFLGVVWGTILFVTWRRLRKKQKEHDADMKYQQSEYKALNALMNPHFIFNSLNNIQGLINKDEKRTANQYLVIFSDLIRQNMHNVSKGFISLHQELVLIENYLTLEKLRFKELINYEILIDEEVDADDIMIPPLMIQPLVENAVKHGLLPKQSSLSKVFIRAFEKGNKICIVIEDNGIGLKQSLKAQNKLYSSFGLSNLQKRIEHLKKIQDQKIDIKVSELTDEHGVVKGTQAMVTIEINQGL